MLFSKMQTISNPDGHFWSLAVLESRAAARVGWLGSFSMEWDDVVLDSAANIDSEHSSVLKH